tara:strand:- start:220 stop:1005 length:786 start_codon:yes stop_codon:yes gene_type:complete
MKELKQSGRIPDYKKNLIYSIWRASFLENDDVVFEGNELVANLNELVKLIKYKAHIDSLKKNLSNYGFSCRLRCKKSLDEKHLIYPINKEMKQFWSEKSKEKTIKEKFKRPISRCGVFNLPPKRKFSDFERDLVNYSFDLLEDNKSKDKQINRLRTKNAKLSNEVDNLKEKNEELERKYLQVGKTSIENSRLVKEKYQLKLKEFSVNLKKKIKKLKQEREKKLKEQELSSLYSHPCHIDWYFNTDMDFGRGQIYSMCVDEF